MKAIPERTLVAGSRGAMAECNTHEEKGSGAQLPPFGAKVGFEGHVGFRRPNLGFEGDIRLPKQICL